MFCLISASTEVYDIFSEGGIAFNLMQVQFKK